MWWVVNAVPRQLYPQERPGTHCIGGWMGPRAHLEGFEKSRPHRDFFKRIIYLFVLSLHKVFLDKLFCGSKCQKVQGV